MEKKFKGTQGIWSIEEGDSFNEFETTILCGKTRIAEVKHFNTGKGDFKDDPIKSVGIENAKLIAAAPDLLEVLEDLLDELSGQSLESSTSLYIQKAREAINKALD